MADSLSSPRYLVAEACMSFADAIIQRKGMATIEEARAQGHELYEWFDAQGALGAGKAPFAVRATQSATKLLLESKRSLELGAVVATIKQDYEIYAA